MKSKIFSIGIIVLVACGIYYTIAFSYLYKPWRIIPYFFFDSCDKSELTGFDYRFFYDTEAWPLAQACRSQDTTEIERLVKIVGIDVNYKEHMRGITVLHSAVAQENAASVRTLLRNGADPNLCMGTEDHPLGNALCLEPSPQIFRYLLEQGGDVNAIVFGHEHLINCWTLQKNDEFFKMLIDAGAQINIDSLCEQERQPIVNCLIDQRYKSVLYLLERGAWYDERITENGHGILDRLRLDCNLVVGSQKHKDKMEVVKFLQEHGLDYWSCPIPDDVMKNIKKNHPKDWEEFCKQY